MEITELDEMIKTIRSLIGKLEKCKPHLKDGSAQVTLLTKRTDALKLSLALINLYKNLLCEQEDSTAALNEMKESGKEKTVRYREVFGQKLINKTMIDIMEQAAANK
jgi:hypothetical protein